MFTVVLFVISETGENPDAHQLVEGEVNCVHPHTEHSSATRGNNVLIHETAGRELGIMMP